MAGPAARPLGRVPLRLGAGDPVRSDLSALVQDGRALWTASDETAAIERLETDDFGSYGRHVSWPLASFFPDMPGGSDGEVDVEGISIDGDWLWVVGSHSLKRERPKPGAEDDPLERLTKVTREANRFLLGRIPLVAEDGKGVREPRRRAGRRRAGRLRMSKKRGALTDLLRHDEHLGRFLDVPAKENGFDVEGIAARGERVLLGLRGPVLRGWAVVLDIEVEAKKKGGLRIRRLWKHFLDLDGLGIRDLDLEGSDLLILAGPTMDLDGPVFVHRWPDALGATEGSVVPRSRLHRLFRVPNGEGTDHPEGMCALRRPGAPPALLVAYDHPPQGRLLGERGVEADLFALPR